MKKLTKMLLLFLPKCAILALTIIMGAVGCSLISASPLLSQPAYAVVALCDNPNIPADQKLALGCDDDSATAEAKVADILSLAFFVIGAVAVIAILYGAVRYILAQGLPGEVAVAKNIILYSIIGLLVAILAWAIVQFIANAIAG